MSDSPFKKKSPPVALPRALEEGTAPRPLFPAHRIGIPVGLAAIGAIAFLELSPASIQPDAASCGTKPSIFERGAEAAKNAFDRVIGNAYVTPVRGTPAVAGGAMAISPPTGTTSATPLGAYPSTTVPLPDDVASPGPDTGPRIDQKFISPGTRHPHMAGAMRAPEPESPKPRAKRTKRERAAEKKMLDELETSIR